MQNSELPDKKTRDIVDKVLRKSGLHNEPEFGSVIMIIMMVAIIVNVIRVIQECNKKKLVGLGSCDKSNLYHADIIDFSKKRGWFTKMRIRKVLRQHMSKDDYHKYGLQIVKGLLDVGEAVTEDEVLTLMEAANV